MTAVIYARYSSDNQREESIEGQIRECTAYAEKNGITVIKHYIDRALSAKTDNRPDFLEEVGLKVKNLRYYKSQPWSFTDTLLMGFFCELDGEDGITLDTDELAMAEWFEREQMSVEAEDLSLTNEMMMAFKHGKM